MAWKIEVRIALELVALCSSTGRTVEPLCEAGGEMGGVCGLGLETACRMGVRSGSEARDGILDN